MTKARELKCLSTDTEAAAGSNRDTVEDAQAVDKS